MQLVSASPSARTRTSSLAPQWIALGLFVLTLALRLPFRSQTLNDWDSVNHALALTSFNVAAHRPQPPGYILYIGAARLVNLLVPDAQTALVLVSVLASALAVMFLFVLGQRMATVSIGLTAAVLLMTSPAFWFDSEVALPYVVEGCASVALALLLYCVLTGERKWAPVAAVVLAISVGMRQQLALFFAPLVLYVFWKQTWRVRIEGLVWFTLVCVLWFVPLIVSTGGLGGYLTALRGLNSGFADEYVLLGTGGLDGLIRNVAHMSAYTLYALNVTVLVLLGGAIAYARDPGIKKLWQDERVRFLLLWIVPSIVFYVFFHMGSPGLIYVFLSALELMAAFVLFRLWRNTPAWRTAATGALCVANIFIFLGTPVDLYIGLQARILNYSNLVAHDQSLSERVKAIQTLDPQTTLVVASDWRFAEYYLPAYRVLFVSPDPAQPFLITRNWQEYYMRAGAAAKELAPIKTVVWYDPQANARGMASPETECLAYGQGQCLQVVHIPVGAQVSVQTSGVQVRMP